jgi:UPF0755 protein
LVPFKIEDNMPVRQIASNLKAAGLIKDTRVFEAYVRLSNTADKLQSGGFQIPQTISVKDLVQRLQQASRDQAKLQFIEGWRREEMADYIDKQHAAGVVDMTGAQFSALALNPTPELRAKLGNKIGPDDSLQGFLFPDTYAIDKDETAASLLAKMIDTYHQKSASLLGGFSQQGLTEAQAVNLAAIVERESHTGPERAIIAGILLKRLQQGIPLYVDATLQYALGYSDSEHTWWRRNLDENDLALDSPYNTRLHAGLPPHPICNPGLTAMEAVAHPQVTDYLYYMHGSDGQAHYAKTLEEHNANVAKYL